MMVRCRTPVRISFAGGGTDFPEWFNKHGGKVLSTAISRYIYVDVIETGGRNIEVIAHDLNKRGFIDVGDDYGGNFDLVKAAARYYDIKGGYRVEIYGELAAASGLGTSSALMVGLLNAFSAVVGESPSDEELAKTACFLERKELALTGGYQDQYAAAFGGLNLIEFSADSVKVKPVSIPNGSMYNEFFHRIILCYTGKTHLSAELQKILLKNYGKADFEEGMLRLMDITDRMYELLTNGSIEDLDEFGKLQHEAWVAKKMTSSKVTNPDIGRLYEFARQNGALGGKITGAGGGGHMLLFCDAVSKPSLIGKLKEQGIEIVHFRPDKRGSERWTIK